MFKEVVFILISFTIIDAGVETQENHETVEVSETGGDGTEGVDKTPDQVEDSSEEYRLSSVMSSTSEYQATEATANDESEILQLTVNETLAEYKQKKLKKKLPADAQLVHFAEKELHLKERMFQQLESTTQEHTTATSMITTQLKELTNMMTGMFMLLQHTYQRPTPFSYHQYGALCVSLSPPVMPVLQRTQQFTTST